MNKTLSIILACAMGLSISSAITLNWTLSEVKALESDTYKTVGVDATGDYSVKLVYVGDGSYTTTSGVLKFNTFEAVADATKAPFPGATTYQASTSLSAPAENADTYNKYIVALFDNTTSQSYFLNTTQANVDDPSSLIFAVDYSGANNPGGVPAVPGYPGSGTASYSQTAPVYMSSQVVPEPATAALALAGLALLLNRRKRSA